MKTSELIGALAADPKPRGMAPAAAIWLALGAGAAISAALFVAAVGPRADFAASVGSSLRFDLKFLVTLALLAPSVLLCLHLMRPTSRPGVGLLLLAAPLILLAVAVVAELTLVPSDLWMTRLVGTNALHCLSIIPLLSIPPLAALIVAMRSGAPDNPTLAGALAGAASAGIAATLYASSCPDDSPLFVATWYPLATLIAVGAGALAGRRFLRW